MNTVVMDIITPFVHCGLWLTGMNVEFFLHQYQPQQRANQFATFESSTLLKSFLKPVLNKNFFKPKYWIHLLLLLLLLLHGGQFDKCTDIKNAIQNYLQIGTLPSP